MYLNNLQNLQGQKRDNRTAQNTRHCCYCSAGKQHFAAATFHLLKYKPTHAHTCTPTHAPLHAFCFSPCGDCLIVLDASDDSGGPLACSSKVDV